MTTFRVHYHVDGKRHTSDIDTKSPKAAASEVLSRHKAKGETAIIDKVKVLTSAA